MSGNPLDARLLEGEGTGFGCLLIHNHASMPAHRLRPRRDEEDFQVAVGSSLATEDASADGTLPAMEDAHLIHRRDELTCPLGGDPVFDRDERWSIVRVWRNYDLGIGLWPEAARSRCWICCKGQRNVAASPPINVSAAKERAVPFPDRSTI